MCPFVSCCCFIIRCAIETIQIGCSAAAIKIQEMNKLDSERPDKNKVQKTGAINALLIVVPDGENSKSRDCKELIENACLSRQCGKLTLFIACKWRFYDSMKNNAVKVVVASPTGCSLTSLPSMMEAQFRICALFYDLSNLSFSSWWRNDWWSHWLRCSYLLSRVPVSHEVDWDKGGVMCCILRVSILLCGLQSFLPFFSSSAPLIEYTNSMICVHHDLLCINVNVHLRMVECTQHHFCLTTLQPHRQPLFSTLSFRFNTIIYHCVVIYLFLCVIIGSLFRCSCSLGLFKFPPPF